MTSLNQFYYACYPSLATLATKFGNYKGQLIIYLCYIFQSHYYKITARYIAVRVETLSLGFFVYQIV